MKKAAATQTRGKIDWMITLVPLAIIVGMSMIMFFSACTKSR